MNVTQTQMLERMQQMMASMAVPQVGTGVGQTAGKTQEGSSFQDLMDRAQSAKDTPAPAKKETTTTQKSDQTEQTDAAQKTTAKPVSKDDPRLKELDPQTQALIAAGIAVPVELDNGAILLSIDQAELPIMTTSVVTDSGEVDLSQPMVIQTGSGKVYEVLMDQDQPVVRQTAEPAQEESNPFQDLTTQLKPEQTVQTVEVKQEAPQAEVETQDAGQDRQQEELPDGSRIQTTVIREPLFKAFEGTPVKVGESYTAVDTQAPDMDAQLAQSIRQAALNGDQAMVIRLEPANLGNVTVQLTQSGDGTLQVVIHAANPKAASLLTQHLDNLHQALQNAGQSQVHVEVQRTENSQQAQQHAFQHADPDGHNQQQQQQRRQEESKQGEDFLQQLRLGLVQLEE